MEKYVSLQMAVKALGPLDPHWGAQQVSNWRRENLLPVLNLVEPDGDGHRAIDLIAVSDLPVLARLIENAKLERGGGRLPSGAAVVTLAELSGLVRKHLAALADQAQTLDQIREARAAGYKRAYAGAYKACAAAEKELTEAKREQAKWNGKVLGAEGEAVKLRKAVHKLDLARKDFREQEFANICRITK